MRRAGRAGRAANLGAMMGNRKRDEIEKRRSGLALANFCNCDRKYLAYCKYSYLTHLAGN